MSDAARVRALAAGTVLAVARDGRTLEDALAGTRAEAGLRPTLRSLAFGTVRWLPELDACLEILAGRRPEELDPEVRALALVGLFQLLHGETPPHAAVSETVEAVRVLRRPRAAGFLNAILRRFLREAESVVTHAHRQPAARHAHPAWLIEALAADWPGQSDALLAANNERAPMWLRVNHRRATVSDYLARLEGAGLAAERCPFAPQALRLAAPADVTALPGFREGDASVQDAAAQLAAPLLGARAGMRVLDACAAPGGKACHVLELEPRLAQMVALDLDAGRAGRIRENLDRLGLQASVLVGDAGDPAGWWDGEPFDRILVDAPCSGTGVIRRHPDIKLLRRPEDIPAFASRQRRLLEATWTLLRPAGRLLYATCSVLRLENAGLLEAFLADHPEAAEVSESARIFLPAQPPFAGPGPGLALPTGAAATDGFYYACIEKRA